jgi:hypothetical protein
VARAPTTDISSAPNIYLRRLYERNSRSRFGPNTIFIFFDIVITSEYEIAQLGAVASTGEHFSTFIKTTKRNNSSHILKKLSDTIYASAAITPKKAMTGLRQWVSHIVAEKSDNGTVESDMVIVPTMAVVTITSFF